MRRLIALILVMVFLTACAAGKTDVAGEGIAESPASIITQESQNDSEMVAEMADKVYEAMMFYYHFEMGMVSTVQGNIYYDAAAGRTYYELSENYNSREKLYEKAGEFYSGEVIQQYIMDEIGTIEDIGKDSAPFLLELNGRMYSDCSRETGKSYSKIEVEDIEIKDNTAAVQLKCLYYTGEWSTETVYLVKEKDGWFFSHPVRF